MRVVAVGAHPDDAEIGAGAWLSALSTAGHEVSVVIVSDGTLRGLDRLIQADLAAARLDVSLAWLGRRDGAVDDGPSLVRELDVHLRGADLVLTHSPGDRHRDHRRVASAVLASTRTAPHANVYLWECDSTDDTFRPQVLVEAGRDAWQAKVDALACHTGQEPHVDVAWLTARARYRGGAAYRLAEAFAVYQGRVPAGPQAGDDPGDDQTPRSEGIDAGPVPGLD